MKKIFLLILILFTLSGCERIVEGNYKEGTYMGSVEYESYGSKYVTTSVIYVDSNGLIKSCYIDSTYLKDNINTTKKTLGDNYGMKETSKNIGNIEGGKEWYEQVEVIEKKVVETQGLDWVEWDQTNTKLDSISGVTIDASTYIEATKKALEQAKINTTS